MRQTQISRWPKRGVGRNRIEPVASPHIVPRFTFRPGSTIFTIGSCFARNIETELGRRGFIVPTRRFWTERSFGEATDNWMLDNYGVPAIYNEIAWAMGEIPYRPEDHIAELRPGLFADKHLSGRVPLEPLAKVLARRNRVFDVTRSLLSADVLVMTLGLAEVWFDKAAQTYLNTRPLQSTLLAEKERYELHILSYEEVKEILEKTFEIVFRQCRHDLKVLITVSPVPMATTFSGVDVVIANQYSKSLLRSVAGAMAAKYPMIDYFPTYESVILSERSRAWEDDQIHIRAELIEHNVSALIRTYTEDCEEPASPTLEKSLPSANDQQILAQAQDHLRHHRYKAAIGTAESLLSGPLRSQGLRVQSSAYISLGHPDVAEHLLREAIQTSFNKGGLHGMLGRALRVQGKLEEAVTALSLAVRYSPDVVAWTVMLAQTLAQLGKNEEAIACAEVGIKTFGPHRVLDRIVSST